MKVVVGCGCCLESLSSFRELKYQQTNSKLGKLWCGNEGLEGVSIGCVCRPFFFSFSLRVLWLWKNRAAGPTTSTTMGVCLSNDIYLLLSAIHR